MYKVNNDDNNNRKHAERRWWEILCNDRYMMSRLVLAQDATESEPGSG